MATTTLAVDVMSGDHGLATTIPAVFEAAASNPDIQFIMVGDTESIQTYNQQHHHTLLSNISIKHASEIVTMDEAPSSALRHKKDSSMRVAINLVKLGEANAAISAGNTGALMATARFVLKMISGIERPAIIAALPTYKNQAVYMLDLGANVNCTAEQLLQFALMGSIMVELIENVSKPTVKLLNIGEEDMKGNELVKTAAQDIENNPQINYQGYIESDRIFHGDCHVVVCDGFVGNSVLKASEGVAKLMGKLLKEEFNKSILNKIRGLIAKNILKNAYKKLDPEIHNGSPLLGLQGIVVKSHGSASAKAFYHAIMHANKAVQHQLPTRIADELNTLKH